MNSGRPTAPPQGTTFVKSLAHAGPTWIINIGDTIYFAAREGGPSASLWKSDGTAAGTVKVAGPPRGPLSATSLASYRSGTRRLQHRQHVRLSGHLLGLDQRRHHRRHGEGPRHIRGRDAGAYGAVGSRGQRDAVHRQRRRRCCRSSALQTAVPPPVPKAVHISDPYTANEGGTSPFTATPPPSRCPQPADVRVGPRRRWRLRRNRARRRSRRRDWHRPDVQRRWPGRPQHASVRFRISDAPATPAPPPRTSRSQRPPTLTSPAAPAPGPGQRVHADVRFVRPRPRHVTQWTVDWGDGVTQTFPGSTTSVTHAFPVQPMTYGISVRGGRGRQLPLRQRRSTRPDVRERRGRYLHGRPGAVPARPARARAGRQDSLAEHDPGELIVQRQEDPCRALPARRHARSDGSATAGARSSGLPPTARWPAASQSSRTASHCRLRHPVAQQHAPGRGCGETEAPARREPGPRVRRH